MRKVKRICKEVSYDKSNKILPSINSFRGRKHNCLFFLMAVAARPFETHYNALNEDVKLRISLGIIFKETYSRWA